MVRFSCFSTPVDNHKSKKVQHSGGAMNVNSQKNSQDPLTKVPSRSATSNPKTDDNNLSSTSVEQTTSPSSHEGCWKSDDLNGSLFPEGSKEFLQMLHIKKSQSLGNIFDKEKGFSCGDVTEDDEIDQGCSFDYSHDKNRKRVNDSFNHTHSAEFYDNENLGMNFYNQHQESNVVQSFDLIADSAHHESLFSIEVLKQFDGEQLADIDEKSADHVADSGYLSSDILPIFARSRSAANLRVDTANTIEDAPTHELMGPRSRSFEHLHSLNEGRTELPNSDEAFCYGVTLHRHIAASNSHNLPQASGVDGKGLPYHTDSGEEHLLSSKSGRFIEDRDGKCWSGGFNFDNKSIEEYNSHNCNGVVNNAREPEADDVEIKKNLHQESPIQNLDQLTSKEFNIKRIEEWIRRIDIQNSPVQELGECSNPTSSKESQMVANVATTKPDARSNLGMEVAYSYISSLTATSSSAQMANLGLVAIPFLSAFVSLRVLNLSGNSIVRITAGALPRGLHMLNLSKNNIAAIEGLRDLTRLRVLDLSCNRIVRIGHGLAFCSALKELHLAGNKISEVEGLHRLLKLNILDLHLNKISTAKGLGQLAANYGSLHAINLEGNPAQRNVGDEQLKKYLLSLLPNLVYYNKQTIRAEVSDRYTRDRGLRTEHKISRKGSHGSGLHKLSGSHVSGLHKLSSNHGRSGLGLTSRHARLPPVVAKPANLPDVRGKLSSLEPSNPIRRSRSEGTL